MEQNNRQQNLIGPVVRRLRMAGGLSQEALAARLQVAGWDITRAGISKIESRIRRVNDAEMLVLARALKCDLIDLFPPKPRDVAQVLRQARG